MEWNGMKKTKSGKTRKHTRWKKYKAVVVKSMGKHNESEDGRIRDSRKISEPCEVGKHSRGKCRELVVAQKKE